MYRNLTVLKDFFSKFGDSFQKIIEFATNVFCTNKKALYKASNFGSIIWDNVPLPLSHANCILINNAQSTKNAYDNPLSIPSVPTKVQTSENICS
jgi:hypothetical protein